jgi:hypothetical protein
MRSATTAVVRLVVPDLGGGRNSTSVAAVDVIRLLWLGASSLVASVRALSFLFLLFSF